MPEPTKIKHYSIRYVFSLFVVNARHKKGITQEELAARVCISRRWIQLIESGKRMPGFCLAVNLILVLEMDPAALFRAIIRQTDSEMPKDASRPRL